MSLTDERCRDALQRPPPRASMCAAQGASHSAMSRHGVGSAAFRAERRWSRRLVCDLTVRILRDGVPMERGCGQNLGLEGMFVALDPTSYSPREVMEVIFTYPDVDGQPVAHRITSAVSHVDVRGIGIQFMRFDPSLFRTVQLMLEQPSRR